MPVIRLQFFKNWLPCFNIVYVHRLVLMTKLQQLCFTSYTAMKVFDTYVTRSNDHIGICISNSFAYVIVYKKYSTIVSKSFSSNKLFYTGFLLTSHSLSLEVFCQKFSVAFKLLCFHMSLLKMFPCHFWLFTSRDSLSLRLQHLRWPSPLNGQ